VLNQVLNHSSTLEKVSPVRLLYILVFCLTILFSDI
jgi:hypothetical protein